MKADTILDDFNALSIDDSKLIDSVRWWEGKRILYNVLLAAIELGSMLYYAEGVVNYGVEDAILNTIIVNIIANIFFCSGWVLEILVYYYFKANQFNNTARQILLFLGITFSILFALLMYTSTLSRFQNY